MAEVPSWELRNQTRSLLGRVEAGESLTITVDGRPVALLAPVGRRARWMSTNEFLSRIVDHQADVELRAVLDEVALEMTDDATLP